MFIRKTKKTDPKTKKAYFSYQLVESVRTKRGPRQRILLSLDADLQLSDGDLKLLANRIEELYSRNSSLFPYPDEIECLAQKYASELIDGLLHCSFAEENPKEESDFQSIDLVTIEQQEPRSVGPEHLLLHFAKELGLPKKLQSLGLSEKQVALSLGTIIGRAAFPASERATHQWLISSSGLGELIDFDFSTTTLDHLYKVSDTLLEHKEELEKYLSTAQTALHNYKSTMVLYDLTNAYLEGRAQSNPKAKRGHSKEKRTDCPLVTLGLVINEYGFPMKSLLLPGNISEPKTLKKAITELDQQEELFKPIIVMDAGIATEENLTWLRENNYPYIVAARQHPPSTELEEELFSLENEIKVALVKTGDSQEQWLYCESPAKEAVAYQMKEAFCKRFENDLQKLSERLNKPKGQKKYTQILQSLGRLKEKHRRISSCYEIEVTPSEDNTLTTSIQWQRKSQKLEDKLNGHYFLRAHLLNQPADVLWPLYNTLRTVEDSFRFMKSDLGLRPIYHQKEHRVDGHLWITLLAYHLIQACLHQLKKEGIFHHWSTIRNCLANRMRITLSAKTESGQVLRYRTTTKAEGDQLKLYKALGLTTQISRAKKSIT